MKIKRLNDARLSTLREIRENSSEYTGRLTFELDGCQYVLLKDQGQFEVEFFSHWNYNLKDVYVCYSYSENSIVTIQKDTPVFRTQVHCNITPVTVSELAEGETFQFNNANYRVVTLNFFQPLPEVHRDQILCYCFDDDRLELFLPDDQVIRTNVNMDVLITSELTDEKCK